MRAWAVASAAAALVQLGCHGPRDPAAASLRSYYYADNSGVTVKSVTAAVDQPVSRDVAVTARAMTEQIVLTRKPLDVGDPGAMQSTGHPPHEPDAVTSASATAGGGAVADEWRVEGIGAVAVDRDLAGDPATGRLLVRGSREPDYLSIYGNAGGDLELFDRNTTISGFAGVGYDHVAPVEAPPGEEGEWPAAHVRVNGGGSLSQILSPRLVVSAGLGATWQHGQLANPYRRALVITTLFPEVVPDSRTRMTAFGALAWYLGGATALHLRQGAYADSWRVFAWIPEAALAWDGLDAILATVRYRFYLQSSAYFYEGRYPDLEPLMSGDARLGRIVGHITGGELRWRALGGEPWSLSVVAGYELSVLDYPDYATALILGHVASLGLAGTY